MQTDLASHRRLVPLVAAALAITSVLLAPAAGAKAAPPRKKAAARASWSPAPVATAAIHPGVQTFTLGPDGSKAQCTANFVYSDGTKVYLGQAAHCAGTGAATETNGCVAQSLPLGTAVEISGDDGRTYHGRLAYSSWLTMQSLHETDPGACAGNDLGLVELLAEPGRDAPATTNPTVPFWGGPVALSAGVDTGDEVYTYGNSELRLGLSPLSPKVGETVDRANGDWTYDVYTASPGIPGDSGSGFLDPAGKALGVLSTLSVLPLPASNQVSDLAHMLTYLHAHSPLTAVNLVAGTTPFTPLL